jgi:hypothetical protein
MTLRQRVYIEKSQKVVVFSNFIGWNLTTDNP